MNKTMDVSRHIHLRSKPVLTLQTMLEIVDAMDSFGTVRTEPTLVIGGGLVTDVSGYACASYRRTSNFIRVPTTLIGLIDASVSIKVGINHKKLKNRYVLPRACQGDAS